MLKSRFIKKDVEKTCPNSYHVENSDMSILSPYIFGFGAYVVPKIHDLAE